MAEFISKMGKAGEINIDHARVATFNSTQYGFYVGDTFEAEDYGDYDWTKGTFKAIVVIYPDNFYANPRYLTTKELTKEANRRNVTTEDELKEMLKHMIEI